MHVFTDLKAGLRLAWRARFAPLSFWIFLVVVLAAWMAAQFSGRQPATVALDVGLSVIRLAVPIIGILLLQELVTREFDRRLYLTSLTYPRNRGAFLLGRFCAVLALVMLLLAVLAAGLASVVGLLAADYQQSTPVSLLSEYWITLGLVYVDAFVVLAVGLLFAVVASTPSFVLVGAVGFMLVARSFSAIVLLLREEGWLVGNAEAYGGALGVLGYLLPDLAALDVRQISLYGDMSLMQSQWVWSFAAALVYGVAFVSLAVLALARKRFV